MLQIKKEFEIEFPNGTEDPDYISFEIKIGVETVDNGFYYDYGDIKNAYHKELSIEAEEKDLKECIITKHTAKELECIYAYIDKHSEEMIEQIIKLYNPKEDSPYFDEYDLD